MAIPYIVEHYREFLPITDKTPLVTLGEGGTPLLRLGADGTRLVKWKEGEPLSLKEDISVLERVISKGNVYLKLENENHPTDSFKDRGMVIAVAKAKEQGKKALMAASTGNTSASASAFGQAYGLPVYVVCPNSAALGKAAQSIMYGAKLIMTEGDFDEAFKFVKCFTNEHPEVKLVNSINKYRIEGQKTAAFEVCDQLGGRAPDYLFVPVGNAGNITAYWKGFKEYESAGKTDSLPRMMGLQAEGADPIVKGRVIEKPQTIASAIRIGNPASWEMAVKARDESEGVISSVTDEEIVRAQYILSAKIGRAIFVEPASAASLAGLIKYEKYALYGIEHGSTVVCVLTGSGLKDTETAIKTAGTYNPILRVSGKNIGDIVTELFRN